MQIKLAISHSHIVRAPGQPVPALILPVQAPGKVARAVPVCKPVAGLRLEKLHSQIVQQAVLLLLFVGCLTSQKHASTPQGRICLDNFTRCHTEIEVADPSFYLTQPQYTDTGPLSVWQHVQLSEQIRPRDTLACCWDVEQIRP